MLILILDGSEKLDKATLTATAEADLVISPDGEIIRSRTGEAGFRINLPELRKVLTTKARPRKGVSAP